MSAGQPVMRTEEAAAYIGISPKTLLNWRSLRKGPVAVKQGRLLAYRQADLDAYLEQHTEERPGVIRD
ncbi:helix-turn-helix domain-containing protein [Curtobacterium sp. MCBA15_004]|uniref:helix-turn-helix domain-containing protein n=1 Tax=Curtobacterium sp. MCBA15_004 TaxID=1898733 RepID=UPI001C313E03|nr:helix-turn-helix domain-containing protein [Curtobacterium sp. MCBA15_004]WIA97652.1 helix-turn-helix domain-containing protein [Curtobacterium sp. MCBA15_004]